MLLSVTHRYLLLALGYILLVLVALNWVLPSPAYAARPTLLGTALLFDLTVLPLAILYALIARPQRWSGAQSGLVGIALFRLALLWLPGSFSSALPAPMVWIGLLEGLLVGLLLFRLRSLLRSYRQHRRTQDAASAWRGALSTVLGERLARLIASEGEIAYYALGSWRQRSDVPVTAKPLTSYHESGQLALLWGLIGISGVELLAVHLLLLRWMPAVAPWMTLLSAYGCLLLLAIIQTTRIRPSFLTREALHLRLDVRWQAVIPRHQIAGVTVISDKLPKQSGRLNAALLVTPNLRLTFREPVRLTGLYGIQKSISELTLSVDGRKDIVEAILTEPLP